MSLITMIALHSYFPHHSQSLGEIWTHDIPTLIVSQKEKKKNIPTLRPKGNVLIKGHLLYLNYIEFIFILKYFFTLNLLLILTIQYGSFTQSRVSY